MSFSIAFCLVVCLVKRPKHGGFRAKNLQKIYFSLKRVDFILLRSFQLLSRLEYLILTYLILFYKLKPNIQTQRVSTRTWIKIIVNTIENFRVYAFVFCNHKRILYIERNGCSYWRLCISFVI